MIRQQKLLNAPLRFLYITAIGMIADCLFERAYLVHLVRLLHLAGLFGTLRASGNLKVVKRKILKSFQGARDTLLPTYQ